MDSIEGVWFPEGGMHAVPVALATAAEKAGATLPLRRDGHRGPALAGTAGSPGSGLASGEQITADAVVCTLDLPVAYAELLPDLRPPRAVRHGATRRRRWSGTSAYAATPTRRSPTTTSTSATSGPRPSTPC